MERGGCATAGRRRRGVRGRRRGLNPVPGTVEGVAGQVDPASAGVAVEHQPVHRGTGQPGRGQGRDILAGSRWRGGVRRVRAAGANRRGTPVEVREEFGAYLSGVRGEYGKPVGHRFPPGLEGVRQVGRGEIGTVPEVVRQSSHGAAQRVLVAGREYERLCVGRLLPGVGHGRFLQHDVGARSTEAERADPGAAREIGPRGVGPAWPGAGGGRDLERSAVEFQQGVLLTEVQAGGNGPVAEHEHRLQQAGDSGSRFQVADVGLHRADQARLGRRCARAPLAAQPPEGGAQSGRLDRVTERGAGAVRLDVADGVHRHVGRTVRLNEQVGLGVRVGCGQRGGTAPVLDRRRLDHRVDRVAVPRRLVVRLEQDDTGALTPDVAIRPAVERLAATVRAEHLPRFQRLVDGGREHQADAAGQRQVAVAGAERGAGLVNGGQGTRTRGVHGDAGTAQIQQVGNPVGDDRQSGPGEAVAFGSAACLPLYLRVVRVRRREEDANSLPGKLGWAVAGVLDSGPDDLQDQPLLRVHQLGLTRGDTEEGGVEAVHPRGETTVADWPALGLPAVRGDLGDQVVPGEQVFPEGVQVVGAGQSGGHPEDRYLAVGRARGPVPRIRRAGGALAGGRRASGRRCRELGEVGDQLRTVVLPQVGGERGQSAAPVEEGRGDLDPEVAAEPSAQGREAHRVHPRLAQRRVRREIHRSGPGQFGHQLGQHPRQRRRYTVRRLRDLLGVRREFGLGAVPGPQFGQRQGGERGAVDLAVQGLREADDLNQRVGHHVFGQPTCEPLRSGKRDAVIEYAARQQRVAAGLLAACDHHCLAYTRFAAQRLLDLLQFDPEAAHLHLGVDPAQVLQAAVGGTADQVSGAVDPGVGSLAVRVGQETFGGQLGAAEIAVSHSASTDVQLAGSPGRYRAAGAVEYVQRGVGDRGAEVDRFAGAEPAHGGPDGRLRGAVEVPHRAVAGQQLLRQVAWQCLTSAEHGQGGVAPPSGGEQHRPGSRGGLRHGGTGSLQSGPQPVAVTGVLGGEDLHRAAGDKREVELQRGDVEADRGQRGEGVAGAEAGLTRHRPQEVGQRPVRDLHTLGAAGGTGGVDDVRGVLRPGGPG